VKILDLHKMRHEDVKDRCHQFININWGRPLKIITGNSREMQNLVCEVINFYDLEFHVGGVSGTEGYIRIRSLDV
jgi:hypothetical protein